MSGVSASSMMKSRALHGRRRAFDPRIDPFPRSLQHRPRPGDDDEIRGVENSREVIPGGNFCKRIGAENEENLRRLPALRHAAPAACERYTRARSSSARRRTTATCRLSVNCQRGKREAVKGAGLRIDGTVRRIVRRDDANLVQPQHLFRGLAGAQVSVVNRVERAAKNAEATLRAHALRRTRAFRRAAPSRSTESSLVVSGFSIVVASSEASRTSMVVSAAVVSALGGPLRDLLPRRLEQRVDAFTSGGGDLQERQLAVS